MQQNWKKFMVKKNSLSELRRESWMLPAIIYSYLSALYALAYAADIAIFSALMVVVNIGLLITILIMNKGKKHVIKSTIGIIVNIITLLIILLIVS